MKLVIIATMIMLVSGCSINTTPYEKLNLDTTSNFNAPTKGKAGIYVYQWKTGIMGAGWDVDCVFKEMPKISLNTGEYAYVEVDPGQYEYRWQGGMFPQYSIVKMEANKNYFFRAYLYNLTDYCVLERDQKEINESKDNIKIGRYEVNTVD